MALPQLCVQSVGLSASLAEKDDKIKGLVAELENEKKKNAELNARVIELTERAEAASAKAKELEVAVTREREVASMWQ